MSAAERYAPVAGVDFAAWCAITTESSTAIQQAAMSGHPMPQDVAAVHGASIALAHGVDGPTWQRVQLVWGSRSALDPQLTMEMAAALAGPYASLMPAGMMPAAPPPVDPSSPALAPIDGVTLESYVRYIGRVLTEGLTTPEACVPVAVACGFPAERWEQIASDWGTRVTQGHPVSTRYFQLVCETLG